ncbi:ribonuclease III [Aulographum hederae CBS 113979]|uniref:Ribonuclease III n=1 Tax=Aulographum hederae CBS 113979 TaxID=1176131 RepID=A0A6G1GLZ5_9PEZI|nr:ribonuclease III [Aulographum hederae CBS 113979]
MSHKKRRFESSNNANYSPVKKPRSSGGWKGDSRNPEASNSSGQHQETRSDEWDPSKVENWDNSYNEWSKEHPAKYPLTPVPSYYNNTSFPKPGAALPALPTINDTDLEERAFTHPSFLSEQSRVSSTHWRETYEELEFIGDGYISIITRRILRAHYPEVPRIQIQRMYQEMNRNTTLAKFTRAYGLEKRLKHNFQDMPDPSEWGKILGDIFEAYVCAVIDSRPDDGFDVVETWLTQLCAPLLLSEFRKLRPVVDPIQAKTDLAKLLMSSKAGVRLEYKEFKPTETDRYRGEYTFHQALYLTGWGHQGLLLGTGSAQGKSQANAICAKNALETKVAIIEEASKKKIAFDKEIREQRAKAEQEEKEGKGSAVEENGDVVKDSASNGKTNVEAENKKEEAVEKEKAVGSEKKKKNGGNEIEERAAAEKVNLGLGMDLPEANDVKPPVKDKKRKKSKVEEYPEEQLKPPKSKSKKEKSTKHKGDLEAGEKPEGSTSKPSEEREKQPKSEKKKKKRKSVEERC